jgi:hypothetical protein
VIYVVMWIIVPTSRKAPHDRADTQSTVVAPYRSLVTCGVTRSAACARAYLADLHDPTP